MTEERLKEIKDSIEFQKKIYEIKGYELGIVQEEIDLYNEVITLKEENERLKKELNKHIKEGIEKDVEKERLYNIINELEKYLIEYSQDLEFRCYANTFLDKLKELKGSNSNEQ